MYLKHLKMTIYGGQILHISYIVLYISEILYISYHWKMQIIFNCTFWMFWPTFYLRITKFLTLCNFIDLLKEKLHYIYTCAFISFFSASKKCPEDYPLQFKFNTTRNSYKMRTKWKTINNSWEEIILHTMTAISITVIKRARCSFVNFINLFNKKYWYENNQIENISKVYRLLIYFDSFS